MIAVNVQFEVDDRPVEPGDLADEVLAELLAQTREQVYHQVQRQLRDLRCEQHGGQPKVIVTGMYDSAAEQMELSYHVDACCQRLLLKAVQALNH